MFQFRNLGVRGGFGKEGCISELLLRLRKRCREIGVHSAWYVSTTYQLQTGLATKAHSCILANVLGGDDDFGATQNYDEHAHDALTKLSTKPNQHRIQLTFFARRRAMARLCVRTGLHIKFAFLSSPTPF